VSVQDLEMILGSIIFRVVEKKKSIILVPTSPLLVQNMENLN